MLGGRHFCPARQWVDGGFGAGPEVEPRIAPHVVEFRRQWSRLVEEIVHGFHERRTGVWLRHRAVPTWLVQYFTASASNAVPARCFRCSQATFEPAAFRYGRWQVMASKTSATAQIRAQG